MAGLFMGLILSVFGAGCAATGTITERMANGPEIRLTSRGVFIGGEKVERLKVPQMLREAEIPFDRTIHIQVDASLEDPSEIKLLMGILRMGGYRRSVVVTERESVGLSRQIRLSTDGFHVGSELVAFGALPEAIARAGFSKDKSVEIFVDEDVRDLSPAQNLRTMLKRIGYRYVEVVETRYDDQVAFFVTAEGVRYGMLTWVEPEEIVVRLRDDQISTDSLVRICGRAKDRNSADVMKIMLYLEDILREAGYARVKRFWIVETPDVKGARW